MAFFCHGRKLFYSGNGTYCNPHRGIFCLPVEVFKETKEKGSIEMLVVPSLDELNRIRKGFSRYPRNAGMFFNGFNKASMGIYQWQ